MYNYEIKRQKMCSLKSPITIGLPNQTKIREFILFDETSLNFDSLANISRFCLNFILLKVPTLKEKTYIYKY